MRFFILSALAAVATANVIDLHMSYDGADETRGNVLSLDKPVHATCENEEAPPRCRWEGTWPFCAGSCNGNSLYKYPSGSSYCGDGWTCQTGMKQLCCQRGFGVNGQHADSKAEPAELEAGESPSFGRADDEYCGKGKHIMCPPGATRNEQCSCLPDIYMKELRQAVLEM